MLRDMCGSVSSLWDHWSRFGENIIWIDDKPNDEMKGEATLFMEFAG